MDYLKISDEKVKVRTGKNWKEWFEILDKWGAKEKGHKATAKYLGEECHLSGWWSQVVTIRYEKEKAIGKEANESLF